MGRNDEGDLGMYKSKGRYDDGDFTDVRAWCVYDGDVTSKVTGLSTNLRDRAKETRYRL